jgi:hypothetical protein
MLTIIILLFIALSILFFFRNTEEKKPQQEEKYCSKKEDTFVGESIEKNSNKLNKFPRSNLQEETPVLNKLLGINTSTLQKGINDKFSKDNDDKNRLEATVIFLNWVNGKSILAKEQYPVYFFYDYNIKNCTNFHKNLIKESFLEKADFESHLNSMVIYELKEILTKYNLKKTGKKEDLIKRIMENVNPEEVRFEEEKYVLSKKGKEFLKENEFVLEIKGTSISVSEFLKEKSSISKPCFTRDIMWKIYNDKSLEYFLKKEFGSYNQIIIEMAQLLGNENNKKLELSFLIKALYSDLSGMKNSNFLCSKKTLFLTPYIAINIYELREYFSENMIDDCFVVKFPFHYCTKEVFKEIVNDILSDDSFGINLEKYFDRMNKGPEFGEFLD